MEFRRASRDDIERLVEIRLAFLGEDYEGLTKEQSQALCEQLLSYYKGHIERDFMAYIAVENHEIVASVFLVIVERPANPSFPTGKIGNILNVYTRSEYRRRGLAGRLMDMMREDAKQYNLSYLELLATQDGYPLYVKKGFHDYKSKCTEMRMEL